MIGTGEAIVLGRLWLLVFGGFDDVFEELIELRGDDDLRAAVALYAFDEYGIVGAVGNDFGYLRECFASAVTDFVVASLL